MAKRIKKLEAIEIVDPNAAGLDIGAEEIWACAPPDREGETVKPFGTFTPDLNRLADWLVNYGVDTVAMILLANARRMACGKKRSRV
jgi:transposase